MTDTSFEICLAPLRGITDAVFRNTYARYFQGIDRAVSPFLSTTQGIKIKNTHFADILPENNTRLPLVPQVIGNHSAEFVVLAKKIFDLGYKQINLNLGCPFPKVARKKRGSGFLPYPERLAEFLSEIMKHCPPGALSIKMRLGYCHGDEILEVLPVLEDYSLQELIIHPRTGKQMYQGRPDLDRFEKCLELTRHAVMYNGDINAPDDFEVLRKRFPVVKSWMIGRGVLRDLFLPARLKGVDLSGVDAVAQLKKFHDSLYAAYANRLSGPSHLINRMKGFWYYFAHNFQDGVSILKSIQKVHRDIHYQGLVARIFSSTVYRPAGSGSKPN